MDFIVDGYNHSKEDLIKASLEYLKKKQKKVNVRMRFVFWRQHGNK